ncbi:hypothetical protein NSK_001627 [Nannochloropsis salina CCMP1776]|uniref:3'-5' exonuclease domain-containing protein n=1 Tax=Nannochloropsis salina CCMP1776 TaxID=1027361 RepID=A0A4D9DCN8_9STRA|nr:hypothetical protein NSK_001627 [Nannochloropsis salina CCMP1776]|eukprot:TFJ87295.1 hypothetical protein NSK_001627 [Nannochloropsis salina CCMP1776]
MAAFETDKSTVPPGTGTPPTAATISSISPFIHRHDVTVEVHSGRGPSLQRLRVHVLPLESDKLEVLLSQVYARVAQRGGIVGMDAEWQPEVLRFERNPVALLQLAWEEDIFLVRLQHMRGKVPASLHRLLADERIIKVGCNIGGDAKRLLKDYALDTRGHVDLREVTQGLGLVQCKRRSMAWLAKEFLRMDMDKSQQCSDWGNLELSAEQIKYSSIDAWVAPAIVGHLFRRYKSQVGQPPCPSSFCKRLVPQYWTRRVGDGHYAKIKRSSPDGRWDVQQQQEREQQKQRSSRDGMTY